jgi:hypothetical protein
MAPGGSVQHEAYRSPKERSFADKCPTPDAQATTLGIERKFVDRKFDPARIRRRGSEHCCGGEGAAERALHA